MDKKISTKKLGNIPETMLITLYSKWTEFTHKNPIVIDKKANEMIKK